MDYSRSNGCCGIIEIFDLQAINTSSDSYSYYTAKSVSVSLRNIFDDILSDSFIETDYWGENETTLSGQKLLLISLIDSQNIPEYEKLLITLLKFKKISTFKNSSSENTVYVYTKKVSYQTLSGMITKLKEYS
jgi:hypothetical protein